MAKKTKKTARRGRPPGPPGSAITIRLPDSAIEMLRSVSHERTNDRQYPFTQSAIVETALAEWFERNGYGK